MVVTSSVSTQRNPFASAAPLAYRPLSAIAATVAGGVPQRRILRILTELIPVLYVLHQKGKIYGNISVHSVGLDESGDAHLMALTSVESTEENRHQVTDGYSPFELYLESSDWPIGPWTDIYGLSAVIYALIVGQRPPTATARSVNDLFQPLSSLGLENYTEEFLQAIDAALALRPADRSQTMKSFSETLGLSAFCVVPPDEPPATQEVASVIWINKRYTHKHSRRGVSALIAVGAMAISGIAVWWVFFKTDQSVITRSELVVKADYPVDSHAVSAPTIKANDERGSTEIAVAQPVSSHVPIESVVPTNALDKPQKAEPKEKAAPALVKVAINVRPWGEIIIDGVSRGVTPPLKTVMLRPGRYAVTIINSARAPYTMTLVVTSDKTAVITHAFR